MFYIFKIFFDKNLKIIDPSWEHTIDKVKERLDKMRNAYERWSCVAYGPCRHLGLIELVACSVSIIVGTLLITIASFSNPSIVPSS